jgi:hypothetical protein
VGSGLSPSRNSLVPSRCRTCILVSGARGRG